MAQLYARAFEYAYSRCVAHTATMSLDVGNVDASSISHMLYGDAYSVTAVFNVNVSGSATLRKITYACRDSGNRLALYLEVLYNTAITSGTYVFYLTSFMPEDRNVSVTLR